MTVVEEFAWFISDDEADALARKLGRLGPALRAELLWWMERRGTDLPSEPPAFGDAMDPGPGALAARLTQSSSSPPAWRKADWAMIEFAISLAHDSPSEWMLRADERGSSLALDVALIALEPPPWFGKTPLTASLILIANPGW